MTFTFDDMRRIIAEHLADDANHPRALDTAIMKACEAAFERGRQAGREEMEGEHDEQIR